MSGQLQPPANEIPIAADGLQHTQAWADYHQSVADALAAVDTGVTDGSDAAAGQIGEYLSASLGSVSLGASTPTNVGSLSLTAGDWDVSGLVTITNTSNALRIVEAWVSIASATPELPAVVASSVNMGSTSLWAGPLRVSSAAASTVYLGAQATASAGTSSASGFIQARRVR